MLPPAPVTFSTTTGLLQTPESLSASRRAVTSGATPGEKPTRIRTVCSGYLACASAFPAAGKSAATTTQIALIGSRKMADSSNGVPETRVGPLKLAIMEIPFVGSDHPAFLIVKANETGFSDLGMVATTERL